MDITVSDVKNVIAKLCDVIIQNEVYFCDLDSAAGDGDFGMSLSKGFREVQKQLDQIDTADVSQFVKGCAMIITEYCGGASGPIWGSGFRAAALCVKGKETVTEQDVPEMIGAAIEGIQKRGGAKLGDKTLLDALIPAQQAMQKAVDEGKPLADAVAQAAKSAAQGAEDTKKIVASKGRASYLGERSIDYPDAGAVAISVIFDSFVKQKQ
ncbi:MAG: dihydroxyacetone kinase subunit DhaL [Christensenella sp.]|nr:dihydroxyacetone kinase subunit DhaL [Christensenella sp.]MEA5003531.1 dihydroxyacetone kinase subunit DhaL [Christensenella sp.]